MHAFARTFARFALGALLLSGCATSGKKIDTEYVSTIERGKTTKTEIREHLGEPQQTVNDAQGGELWIYAYVEGKSFLRRSPLAVAFLGQDPIKSTETLRVNFAGDIVRDYAFHNETHN